MKRTKQQVSGSFYLIQHLIRILNHSAVIIRNGKRIGQTLTTMPEIRIIWDRQ